MVRELKRGIVIPFYQKSLLWGAVGCTDLCLNCFNHDLEPFGHEGLASAIMEGPVEKIRACVQAHFGPPPLPRPCTTATLAFSFTACGSLRPLGAFAVDFPLSQSPFQCLVILPLSP